MLTIVAALKCAARGAPEDPAVPIDVHEVDPLLLKLGTIHYDTVALHRAALYRDHVSDDRDVEPFPISPDLMAWLKERAAAKHRGNVGVAIIAILKDARAAERTQEASRRVGGLPENPDRGKPSSDPWGDIGR